MKLKLPHRDVILKSDIEFEERNEIIESVLLENMKFHSKEMSVEEYFRETWDKPATKTALDMIGYYLTKGNAEGEDREVLSHRKAEEMRKGSSRHTTFSSMDYGRQEEFGIIDVDDSNFN